MALDMLGTGEDLIEYNWGDQEVVQDGMGPLRILELVDTAESSFKHSLVVLHILNPREITIQVCQKLLDDWIDDIILSLI